MPIYASAGNSSETFAPAPTGVHQAVCCDVVDLGVLEVTYAGQTKKQHKVRVVWQIEELMEDGKPFIASRRYTLSLGDKASLRKDLESWRGRPFTSDELRQFDLEVLIGVNCLLNVSHTKKNDRVWADVTAVMPLKKGMTKMDVRDYVRVKDRSEGQQQARDEEPPISDDDIPF